MLDHTARPKLRAAVTTDGAPVRWEAVLWSPAAGWSPQRDGLPALLPVAVHDETAFAELVQWWCAGTVLRWNELARDLTAQHHLNSSNSARLFAALAVAQHDAARAALLHSTSATAAGDDGRWAERGCGPREGGGHPVDAAVAHASIRVLGQFFPDERAFLAANEAALLHAKRWAGAFGPDAVDEGRAIGAAAADAVLERLQGDGADQAADNPVAAVPGLWWAKVQNYPGWGKVRTWVIGDPVAYRAPLPPAADSAEFTAAVQEIRKYSDFRTVEQLLLARYWNLGVGGISVPGMWNQLALRSAGAAEWSELDQARLLVQLHLSQFDASVACWESKYHYRVKRPSMVDAAISEPLGLPPHPSYPSGHSAFSGAAAEVLAARFPEHADHFRAMANEASASRFYGGIHYRFDGDAGLRQGEAVARAVMQAFPWSGAVAGPPIAK